MSAARSESRWPRISTWSSSGSSSITSARRSSSIAATTAVRRSAGRSWMTLAASAARISLRAAMSWVAPWVSSRRVEALDVAPVDDVGLALAPEALGRLLHGDPAEHPVAVALLLHGDVVDRAAHAGRRDGHGAVEHLADHQRLGGPLLEAAHVQQAGRVDLPGVDVGHPGHRHEDPAPAEDLGDEAEHAGLVTLGPQRHDEVADLADLVALGVEDRQTDQAGRIDAGRGGAHARHATGRDGSGPAGSR